MPFNIFGVLAEIKNDYDVNTDERKALSIIENKLYENKKLKEQLEIAVNTLNVYGDVTNWNNEYDLESADFTPLYRHNKWKKEKGYKLAVDTLKQIKELEQ